MCRYKNSNVLLKLQLLQGGRLEGDENLEHTGSSFQAILVNYQQFREHVLGN